MAQQHNIHQHNADGIHYPTHYLITVIDDRDEAERAVQALRAAGFDEGDITIFHGHEAFVAIQEQERHLSFFSRVANALHGSEEDRHDYLATLRGGASNLLVYAPLPAHVRQAREVLRRYHAHMIAYHGAATIENLPALP